MNYSRRDLLKCLVAGGMLIAGELWVPGAKKIFLPSPKKIIAMTLDIQLTAGNVNGISKIWIDGKEWKQQIKTIA